MRMSNVEFVKGVAPRGASSFSHKVTKCTKHGLPWRVGQLHPTPCSSWLRVRKSRATQRTNAHDDLSCPSLGEFATLSFFEPHKLYQVCVPLVSIYPLVQLSSHLPLACSCADMPPL